MNRVAAGVAFLTIFAAGAAGALERVARPILDVDAPAGESRAEEWRSSCDVPVSYYNACTGWLWTWSDFEEPIHATTIFDARGCGELGVPRVSQTSLYTVDAVPAGYGYTGTISLRSLNPSGCPASFPLVQTPFLPTTSPWTTVNWGGLFQVPNRFAVVVSLPSVWNSPVTLASDHPAAGPTGPRGLGTCYPTFRATHSYFYDSSASSCSLTPLFDSVANAEWIWTCSGDIFLPSPSHPAFVQLAVSVGAGGSALPASGTYPYGAQVALLAVPNTDFIFKEWSGNGIGSYTGTDNPKTVTLHDNVTQHATFERRVDAVEIEVSFLSDPVAMRVALDGAEERTPVSRSWFQLSIHDVEVDSLAADGPTARFRFDEWSDGATNAHRDFEVPMLGPASLSARFDREFAIEVASSNGGSTVDPVDWAVEGSQHSILAIPDFGYEFVAWVGTGAGSYSGPANPATITALGPIHETPMFESIYSGTGSNFTISASDTDPHVTSSAPTGTIRSLHLWLTCSDRGISAFEANVTGSLTPLGFNSAPGFLNVGSPDHLLLAVGGCPNGTPSPVRLGEWVIVDHGGTMCLSSEPSGVIGTVDCDVVNPSLWLDPRVEGFASDGSAPCVVGNNACVGTSVLPTSIASDEPAAPVSTRIVAMHPNPFTRECRIEYSIARDAAVRLDVFDVRGRRLRSLSEGNVPAGFGVARWDGRNDDGRRAPGGVYFVMLESGGVRETKKVVFLSGRD